MTWRSRLTNALEELYMSDRRRDSEPDEHPAAGREGPARRADQDFAASQLELARHAKGDFTTAHDADYRAPEVSKQAHPGRR